MIDPANRQPNHRASGPGWRWQHYVVAPNLIYLLGGTLDAQAEGDGGNLTSRPFSFVLNQSGLISKSSSANGGNITINSDYFLHSERD